MRSPFRARILLPKFIAAGRERLRPSLHFLLNQPDGQLGSAALHQTARTAPPVERDFPSGTWSALEYLSSWPLRGIDIDHFEQERGLPKILVLAGCGLRAAPPPVLK